MKRNKIYHSTWLNFFKEFQFLRKKNLLQRTVRPSSRDSFDYLRLSFEINLTPLASPKFMPSRFKQFLTKKPEPFTEQKSQRSGWGGDDSLIICFFLLPCCAAPQFMAAQIYLDKFLRPVLAGWPHHRNSAGEGGRHFGTTKFFARWTARWENASSFARWGWRVRKNGQNWLFILIFFYFLYFICKNRSLKKCKSLYKRSHQLFLSTRLSHSTQRHWRIRLPWFSSIFDESAFFAFRKEKRILGAPGGHPLSFVGRIGAHRVGEITLQLRFVGQQSQQRQRAKNSVVAYISGL